MGLLNLIQECCFADLGSVDGDLQFAEDLLPLVGCHGIKGGFKQPKQSGWPLLLEKIKEIPFVHLIAPIFYRVEVPIVS